MPKLVWSIVAMLLLASTFARPTRAGLKRCTSGFDVSIEVGPTHAVADTFEIEIGPHIDWAYSGAAEWHLALPPQLRLLSGSLSREGLAEQCKHQERVRVVRDGSGPFVVVATIRAENDAANWMSDSLIATIGIDEHGFTMSRRHGCMQYVAEGVRHRLDGSLWVPLDEGESPCEILPKSVRNSRPAVVHREPGRVEGRTSIGRVAEVEVIVAAGRDGRVKDAIPASLGLEPQDVYEAALMAARRWRFAPFLLGTEPRTMVYRIPVPVNAGE